MPDAWGAGGISFDDLDASVAYGTEVCSEHDGYDGAGPPPQPGPVHQPCFSCEVLRIRRLASDGWPPLAEDPSPIFVDVGLGDYRPDWPILDGNHRLAAALWRGDTTIDVAVGGDWECAVHLLVDAPSDAARASSPDGPA